jgi:hypothetical protein
MTWKRRPPQGSLLKARRQLALAFSLAFEQFPAMTGLAPFSIALPC